jgi:arsenate reductase
MQDKTYHVLVLCTGNSARSILGEALFNTLGKGRIKAYSAGSHPAGKVNPYALELLQKIGIDTNGLRSKSWDEFAAPGSPEFDFVFTVCDNAAGETCPVWIGRPMTAHWGIPDPAAAQGSDEDKRRAFALAEKQLRTRISLFLSLPLQSLDKLALKKEIDEIGKLRDRGE